MCRLSLPVDVRVTDVHATAVHSTHDELLQQTQLFLLQTARDVIIAQLPLAA